MHVRFTLNRVDEDSNVRTPGKGRLANICTRLRAVTPESADHTNLAVTTSTVDIIAVTVCRLGP